MRKILYLGIFVLSLLSIFGFTKKTELKFDTNPDIDISGNMDNIWRNTGEYDGIYVILMREDKEVFGKYIDKDSEENPLQGRPLEEEWFITAKNDVEPYGVDKIIKYNGKEVKPGTAFYDKPSMIGKTIILTVEDKPKEIYLVKDGNKVGTIFNDWLSTSYGSKGDKSECKSRVNIFSNFKIDDAQLRSQCVTSRGKFDSTTYNKVKKVLNINPLNSFQKGFYRTSTGGSRYAYYIQSDGDSRGRSLYTQYSLSSCGLTFGEGKRTIDGSTGYFIGDGNTGGRIAQLCIVGITIPQEVLENKNKYKLVMDMALFARNNAGDTSGNHSDAMSEMGYFKSDPYVGDIGLGIYKDNINNMCIATVKGKSPSGPKRALLNKPCYIERTKQGLQHKAEYTIDLSTVTPDSSNNMYIYTYNYVKCNAKGFTCYEPKRDSGSYKVQGAFFFYNLYFAPKD